jgi:hypothetical protein
VSGASSFHHVAAVNETQRGMVAARKADLKWGGDRKSFKTSARGLDPETTSQESAADLLGVSKGTVHDHRKSIGGCTSSAIARDGCSESGLTIPIKVASQSSLAVATEVSPNHVELGQSSLS